MLVTYLRSSSVNDFRLCEHKYFIGYVLGKRSKAGIAAEKGTLIHKVLELIALSTIQDEVDDDLLGPISLVKLDPNETLNKVYVATTNVSSFPYSSSDKKECEKLLNVVLDSEYDPRQLKILEAEKHFEHTITKPWGRYKYLIGEEEVEGNLCLKGTVDLVTEVDEKTIEIVDWKTGKWRSDFATGKEKSYLDFYEDFQLRFYHYVLTHIYPDKDIIITIFYVQKGGPFTITFNKEDVAKTEQLIKKYYENILNVQKPKLLADTPDRWKCKICSFSKDEIGGKSVCEFFRREIYKNGIVKTTANYIDLSKLNEYEGGGRKNVQSENSGEKVNRVRDSPN